MKKYLCLILLLICYCSLAQENKQIDIFWPSLSKSPWPMTQHDPQATGRTNFKGPKTSNTIWKVIKKYGVNSGPVISSSNILYFGVDWNLFFYSMNADTSFNWEYNGNRNQFTSGGVIVDADENIYVGSGDDSFYCFNKDGSLKWKYKTGGSISTPFINIGLDTTLYFSSYDSFLFAVTKTGNLKWKLTIDDGFSYRAPVLSPDGKTIYIGGRNNNLYALNNNATLKWKFECAKINTIPVVDSQGNIYVIALNERVSSILYSLKPDGSIRWSYLLVTNPGYNSNPSSPCIDKEGNIFVLNNTNILSVDYNGRLRWDNPISPVPVGVYCPLACDAEGKVYFGCTGGTNYYCYSNDGKLLWNLPLGGNQVDNPPAFGNDGTLYIPVHKGPDNYAIIAVKDKVTSIKDMYAMPSAFSLSQNYPNPFNPSTTINYSIPVETPGSSRTSLRHVSLIVHDVLGREIKTLVNEEKPAGNYFIQFDGSTLSSGIYFYRLQTKYYTETKKMILLK
jgi:hypothetical protein